ncbi:4-hydroxythreonine-4-phosphate dehydrogenase PdxA [Aquabacterium sp. OR-4]|uniref:4-hydroxythreonine-4-phosphate dehydrogenase PdxA n=1 Tax=Aquabacterium sp. OR-4 TaxID=2978127 RepID=UPI0021B45381|nr:4-hydroxythreonine-4-phosphate dehydrogenase PdxA [Aquabacterium sp. OR-4]MDT7834577.1 4-hydroxythreonine-4-phosphate dehydrogenase PdxA [Aquabacterium sp. OR-4]
MASNPSSLLAVSMGDPCGIGPEIIAKAVATRSLGPVLVVGSVAVMRRAVAQCGLLLPVAVLEAPADAGQAPPGCLPVWQPPGLPEALAQLPMGAIHADAGQAAARCIEAGAALVQAGTASALVTAPIHKEALAAAGVPYPGHTEMLQALAGGAPVRMMLANEQLRVVLVTIHVALRRAIELLDEAGILQTLRIAHAAAAAWGQARPRIAVAGLNPHAGEGGLFGDEELRIIAPAIAAARAEGIDASGPYAPDTVFMRARHAPPAHPGEFDLVVAMTHDHGLIPVKYLGVEEGVNVTLGLPFVRTSPDHGTAFDIAGSGRADAASLIAAARMARALSGA